MPTASEYDGFANDFTLLLGPVEEARAAVEGERSKPGIGGTFGSLVDITIDSITDRTPRAVGDLEEAAAECTRRADICEGFFEDMRKYRHALDRWEDLMDDFDPADPWNSLPGPRPSEPEPPFPWVEI